MKCKVKVCEEEVHAKSGQYAGYCGIHRMRLMRHDDINYINSPFQRFKKYIKVIQRDYETPCWEWQRSLSKKGYGKFKVNSQNVSAHVFSYEYFKGKIPKGLQVHHKCNNPSCCNPDHLVLGTHQDNMNYKVKCNRQCKGISINTAKLTSSDILSIRAMYNDNKGVFGIINQLAKQFKINRNQISAIINRKAWKHI